VPEKHKRTILKSTKKTDGMAYHHHSTGHAINFDGTEIITEEKIIGGGLLLRVWKSKAWVKIELTGK